MKSNIENRKYPKAEFLGSYVNSSAIESNKSQIAFLGRSNSGKSSLLSLLIENPSIVKISGKPGSTKTINVFSYNSEANDKVLIDLPGYGYAKMSKKSRNLLSDIIYNYLSKSRFLKAGFLTLDCRRQPQQEELELAEYFRTNGLLLNLVFTKTDKLNQKETAKLKKNAKKWDAFFHQIIFSSIKKPSSIESIYYFLNSM